MTSAWGVSWGNAWGNSWGGKGPTPATIVGGHFIPEGNKGKRTLSNVLTIYNKAKALSRKDTKELRDAVAAFVPPEVAMVAKVPDIARVDYSALEANAVAYEKFAKAIDSIEKSLEAQIKMEQEDDDLMLVSIISLLIH